MADTKLILDYVYGHEASMPDRVYLTQPLGNDQVANYTWAQLMDQSRRMATHLQGQGFAPGSKIAILSKNCAHFIMAELAIWMAGHTTVAIFPTETADTVRYVLEHSEASLLFVGKLDTWAQQTPGVPAGLPCVAFPLAPKTSFQTWDSIINRTEPMAGQTRRQPDDLAMLMYTSGSTGTPKGVMHSFDAATKASMGIAAELRRQIQGDVRLLSYLPLAHIFERAWIECSSYIDGKYHIYFAESLDTFLADLQRARPTAFISVPRLWLKFQQGVFAKMPPKKLDMLLGIPFLGRIVARKVLTGLGMDQVQLAGSGSAPIPADLIVWYKRLGLNLSEGYGMTEDFAYSFNSTAEKSAPGCVGVTMPGVQARISPEGEIQIKSPGKLVGYYKQPELDAECFTEDGFFRTGDLGEIRSDGLLKITGRAKEQFKTAKGKYVAPAPIENRINAHPMVEQSIVSGVGQSAAYALVVLAEGLRPRQDDAAVRKEVETEFTRLLDEVNAKVADYEQLKMIVIAREPWSIENGCLTPTMKIKRARIETMSAPQIEAWYGNQKKVMWA
ncbi:AMP-binding acetyl-CoA synthetase [Hydrogenophaga crassostreae]|uniref:AMP-binding acetyl-CoA synthetase n=1 Tax=Hydrogenophaga crassostreae TaxID=1763535 RepID=A0A162P409_9BURK|nr:AMP-binding protein [Hydrogenophaga crassostreae]AOW12197.1 AMP-binding acetyl-CoA synthetase [Hydrogenophaga crassostreae]OAD41142.1 AMP-binding acetyl-CoA synthetase [Hydrogenophaga crassostreae]